MNISDEDIIRAEDVPEIFTRPISFELLETIDVEALQKQMTPEMIDDLVHRVGLQVEPSDNSEVNDEINAILQKIFKWGDDGWRVGVYAPPGYEITYEKDLELPSFVTDHLRLSLDVVGKFMPTKIVNYAVENNIIYVFS